MTRMIEGGIVPNNKSEVSPVDNEPKHKAVLMTPQLQAVLDHKFVSVNRPSAYAEGQAIEEDGDEILVGRPLRSEVKKELDDANAKWKNEQEMKLPKVIISENEPKPRKKTESEIRLEQIERNREGERKAAEEFAKRNPAEATARRAEAKARAEKSYARVDFGLTEEQKATLRGNNAPEISLFERYKKGSIAFDDMTEAEKKELQRQISAAKRGNG